MNTEETPLSKTLAIYAQNWNKIKAVDKRIAVLTRHKEALKKSCETTLTALAPLIKPLKKSYTMLGEELHLRYKDQVFKVTVNPTLGDKTSISVSEVEMAVEAQA